MTQLYTPLGDKTSTWGGLRVTLLVYTGVSRIVPTPVYPCLNPQNLRVRRLTWQKELGRCASGH